MAAILLSGPALPVALLGVAVSRGGKDGHRGRRHLQAPPFARIAPQLGSGGASAAAAADAHDPRFSSWLEALAAGELAADAVNAAGAAKEPPRAHANEWYADRCIFCAACRMAVDAEAGRRGSRCAGCRRWFHARCQPPPPPPEGGGSGKGVRAGVAARGRFFHSEDCRRGYSVLRSEAAQGSRRLPEPPPPGGLLGGLVATLFGRKPGSEPEPLTLRLIDLSEARRQYSSLAQSGLLRARRDALLRRAGLAPLREGGAGAAAGDGDDASSGDSELGGGAAADRGGGGRAGGGSAVDDFIVAAELLTRQYPDDEVNDILEDSFAVLLRRGATPLAAATLNLYAPEHARIQALVSATGQRRRGHAALLLGELHGLLAAAGLERVVAAVAEDTDEARAARDKLLRRRYGYRPVPIETLVAWRADLPEYHKSLMAGVTLLERPLQPSDVRKKE